VLTGGAFVAQAGFSMVVSFLPIYLQQMGTTKDVALWSGLVFAVTSFTYALVAPLWGAVSDRVGKRTMLMRSGIGIAITYLLMAASHTHIQLFLARALMGLLSGFVPAATMLVASNTPEEHLGPALGAIQTAVAIGTISGPLIGGALNDHIAPRAIWIGGLLVGLTSSLGLFIYKSARKASLEAAAVVSPEMEQE
jgi:DHA1 family multidrug resistance protein-like MFS transporter